MKTSRTKMSQTLCFTSVVPGCNSRYLRSTSATFDKQSTQHVMPHSLLRHFVYLHRFDGVVRALLNSHSPSLCRLPRDKAVSLQTTACRGIDTTTR